MATFYTYPTLWEALAIRERTDDTGTHADDSDFTDTSARLAGRLTTAGVIEGLEVSKGGSFELIVSKGLAAIDGQQVGQGRYLAELIGDVEGVAIPASHLTLARTDLLALVVRDHNYDLGDHGIVAVGYVEGTPGAGAPDPDPSWSAYLPLAHITVPAGAFSSDDITLTPLSDFARSSLLGGGDIGDIKLTAAAAAPPGWLFCHGQLLERAEYPRLFAVIGTTYGSTSPSNFRVPDLRVRFPIGAGEGFDLGATGGSINHTHSLPNHTHGAGELATNSTGAHTHSVSGNTGATSVAHTHSLGGSTGNSSPGTSTNGSHSHSTGSSNNNVTTNATAGSALVLSYGSHGHSTSSSGSHSHTVNAHSHSLPANTGGASSTSHTHSVSLTAASNGNHSHTVTGTTAPGGSGSSGSANPPYLALNYVIKY